MPPVEEAVAAGAKLIENLRIGLQAASAMPVRVVETHISWVLLADTMAYKVKKPVRLPFVDFSNVAVRRRFCEQELRLNRRLAHALYLGVTRVTGTPEHPTLDGDGPAIDYAVRMRRFPPGSLLSEHLAAGTLRAADIDRLAERIAMFHAAAPRVGRGTPLGSPAVRIGAALRTLDTLLPLAPAHAADLRHLRGWFNARAETLEPLWTARQQGGKVRDVHGDLHLANTLLLEDEVVAFDCVEFDESLRCIDVLDDAAFAAMDLMARGRADLGHRFINAYLDLGGDHAGVPCLRFAMAACALVRALVGWLAPVAQGGHPPPTAYLDLALRLADRRDPRLLVTHGLPGSGKTFVSQQLLERCGAIRLRSDVERKRLFGLDALSDSRALDAPIYGAAAGARTYARLSAMARIALQAGHPTIIDAAFLRTSEREHAQALARELGVPFTILDCRAPWPLLRERVLARQARHDDASEADTVVLERLKAVCEPLSEHERATAIVVDGAQAIDVAAVGARWLDAAAR